MRNCHLISHSRDVDAKICALQGTGVGSSALAVSILGPWRSAPKAARDAYERFVMAVSALLGGEASSEEVWLWLR